MQQIVQTIFLAYNNLPWIYRGMLGLLTVITLCITVWCSFLCHLKHISGIKGGKLEVRQFQVMLPENSEPIDTDHSIVDNELLNNELNQKGVGEECIHEHLISSGDTLNNILTQYDIDMLDVMLLVTHYKDLRNLQVGQLLSWTRNASGDLQQLRWEVSQSETRIYDRIGNSFKESHQLQHGIWRNSIVKGRLSGSFISSANNAGLNCTEINTIVKALQWRLNFHKLLKGDQFSVLISRKYFDDKQTQSHMLAVRIRTGGKDYYAIRAEDGKFYDCKGFSLAHDFMRFPTIKRFRISSAFNPRRVNPITGRIAPHKGVDFAMPIGTPVMAVSDGEVLIAKHSWSAGYYVAIRHGCQYTTRYMHLKKLLVKSGNKVKYGALIGLSGNSGHSTGPHLHFELWINQQAVNPLTAKLPQSKGLIGTIRSTYLAQITKIVMQLQFD